MILVNGEFLPKEILENNTSYEVITNFKSVEKLKEYLDLYLNQTSIYEYIKEEYIENGCWGNNIESLDDFIEKNIAKINSKDFYLLEIHKSHLHLYLTDSKEEVFENLFHRNSKNLVEEHEKGNIYFFDSDKEFIPFFDKKVKYLKTKSFNIKGKEKAIEKIKAKVRGNRGFEQMGIFLVEKILSEEYEYIVFDEEYKAKRFLKKLEDENN